MAFSARGFSAAADYSLEADALPEPISDPTAEATIRQHASLFRVVTPLRPAAFEHLLRNHPNRPFVRSWGIALREGVWPFAQPFPCGPAPFPDNRPSVAEHMPLLREARDREVLAGRWSAGFTTPLRGMRVSPLGFVPKSSSPVPRLITDQSFPRPRNGIPAGAVNDAFPRAARRVQYDSLWDMVSHVCHLAQSVPGLWAEGGFAVWKADAANAFRLIPVHPLWQLNQVVRVDGVFHIDRCVVFGGGTSPRVWCSFLSPILWVVRLVHQLNAFVDDLFGVCVWNPASPDRPVSQVAALQAFDEVGIPYVLAKAPFGRQVEVVGIVVDLDAMSLCLSAAKRTRLLSELDAWISAGVRLVWLREVQELTGRLTWASLVVPELCPFMSRLYGAIPAWALCGRVSDSVLADLRLLRSMVTTAPTVRLFSTVEWPEEEATLRVYVDACTTGAGIGVVFPQLSLALAITFPAEAGRRPHINVLEASAVWCALYHAWGRCDVVRSRVLIYCDNLTVVHAFQRLYSSSAPVIMLFRNVAQRRLRFPLELVRVVHIPGAENTAADAVSRREFPRARAVYPDLKVQRKRMAFLSEVAAACPLDPNAAAEFSAEAEAAFE
jgi:hypothetical protein